MWRGRSCNWQFSFSLLPRRCRRCLSCWKAVYGTQYSVFFLVLNILGEPGAHECKDAREKKTRSKDSLFCTYLFSAPHALPPVDAAAAAAERPSSLSQRQLFRICVRHEKNRSEERGAGEIKVCRSLHMTKKCISQVLPPPPPPF